MYRIDLDYARQLATRRKDRGLSQHALGQLCGLTEVIVCRIETGRTPADPERRACIDAALAAIEQEQMCAAGGER
jgi:transcriptional regulator with XRE-family HTH domain